nr:hypothetical protein [Tanacetum cinerariifolium]
MLDALALTPFYQAFLITAEKFSLDVEVFREILQICLKVPGQRFAEPPLEHDILSFLRDLGHSGDVHYITDSISRRNKMFWHTARDDIMFTSMKCVSKHEKTQVYGAILPRHLTNQAMLESIAYQTYYAYATGEKALKEKYVQKKAESDTSPKKKTAPASKSFRIKSSAKVAKTDKKSNLPRYQRPKDWMYSLSGSGNGVDTQSKVPDEQQQKVSSTNEGAGVRPETGVNDDSEETKSDNDRDDLTHPNLSTYKADDEEEEEEKADDDKVSSDQRVSTLPEYELTKAEEENKEGEDEDMEGEHEQDEEDDLYRDVNINLEISDAKMTNAQANQDTEDIHVTLTIVPLVVQQESSSVSLDLVSKFINPSSDQGIDSILNPDIQSETLINVPVSIAAETPSSNTIIPQPPIPNIQPLQQTPDALDVAIQLQTNKLREEAQAENQEFLNQRGRDDQDKDEDPSAGSNRGSNRRRSGKEAESSKEPTHKESKSTSSSKGASRSQPKSSGKSAYVEEHGQKVDDLEDQPLQDFNTGNDDVTLLREVLDDDESTSKNVVELEYHWEEVFKATNDRLDWHNPEGKPYPHDLSKPLSSSSQKYTTSITKTKAVDYGQVKWIEDKVSRIWSPVKVVYNKHTYWGTYHWGPKRQKFYEYASNMETSKDVYSRHMIIAVTSLKIMKYFCYSHLEEIIVRRQNDQLYKFREGDFKRHCRQEIEDIRIVIQERVEDLQMGVESYQKKINLTRPDTYLLDLKRMTPYTAYPDIQGIIYEDEMNRYRLIRTDELHKFSDGTLNHVCTALGDIATRIEMNYLPKRKWCKQGKQRTRVMINAIDKKLKDRRLMRNLEKFISGRPYKGDLWLLERII